jgi:hypothetical protein
MLLSDKVVHCDSAKLQDGSHLLKSNCCTAQISSELMRGLQRYQDSLRSSGRLQEYVGFMQVNPHSLASVWH